MLRDILTGMVCQIRRILPICEEAQQRCSERYCVPPRDQETGGAMGNDFHNATTLGANDRAASELCLQQGLRGPLRARAGKDIDIQRPQSAPGVGKIAGKMYSALQVPPGDQTFQGVPVSAIANNEEMIIRDIVADAVESL